MFLLNILPDALLHAIVIFSVLALVSSFFFDFIPFVAQYKLPIQVVAIVVLTFGIYLEGGLSEKKEWQLKVAEVEKELLVARAESAEANTKLVEKLKENEMLRKERQNATHTIIKQVAAKTDSQCTLSNGFIRLHNSASQDQIPDSTRQSDGDASDVKPSEFLTTVTDNYATCYNIREKLIGWQNWYKTQKEIYEK